MGWQQWAERGIYYQPAAYGKQELIIAGIEPPGSIPQSAAPQGSESQRSAPQGFSTSTGKLELANEFLDSLGAGRLPSPAPIPKDKQRPYTLITGARMQPYWASSYFNNPQFRRAHPLPTAQLSQATMQAAGLEQGQWLTVSTAGGEARFVAEAVEMVDGVVSVEYGWWYPEEEPGEPGLSGIWRSNANLLTSADIKDCEPLIGSWAYNGIPCDIRAVQL
jgi:anaerobic selenocysteine-containing dehydrogenase